MYAEYITQKYLSSELGSDPIIITPQNQNVNETLYLCEQ